MHGSTVATNAVLERRGARVGLVATRGFEDVLRIGRQTRKELYNFQVADRAPLVGEGMTLGVDERMLADGSVRRALDPDVLDGWWRSCAPAVPSASRSASSTPTRTRHTSG